MRYLLALIVVIVPAIAFAKPAVAVVPFEDDDGGKAASVVEKALDKEASSVIGHKETGKAMKKLKLSGTLDKADKKKLRKKLEVDVLVEGKVEDNKVELRVSGKGVKTSRFRVDRKKLKAELPDELGRRLSPDKSDEEDEEEVAKPPPRKIEKVEEDDDKPKRRRVAEEEEGEGDEEVKVKKKRKKRRDDDDEEPAGRHLVTQTAIRVTAGVGFARRGLTYSASGNAGPPPVGTAAPTGRIEVEAYPGAMESTPHAERSLAKTLAAGFGLYGHFERALILSIDVPGGGNTPITQQGYSIGARYRVVFGQHAVAFGVGYAARQYTADRSGLGMMQTLDMPDTSYGAIAPNVIGRFAATPTVGVYAGGAFELLLAAGDITETYGYAKTLAFGLQGGADIAFTPRYGLRIGAELHQVGFSFQKPQRGVSAATDRTIGVTASFEVLY